MIVCGAGMLSGKEYVSLELADAFAKRGSKVSFLTSRWGSSAFQDQLRLNGYSFHLSSLGFISKTLAWKPILMTLHQLLHLPLLYCHFIRAVKTEKPERVIHTNWHHALLLLPFLRKGRDVFWLHESITNSRFYSFVFSMLSKRIGHFVAVSDATKDTLLAINIPDTQVRRIHNGIRDPNPTGTAAPKVPPQTIGIVGQVAPWKGHDQLLLAFAEIIKDFPKASLHIFGNSETLFAVEIRRRAKLLQLTDKIIWHGFISNKHDLFSKIELLVVPSTQQDPLPTVAIEAAYFSKPVVAYANGGLKEIVIDSHTGFLVTPGSHHGLRRAISTLLEKPDLKCAFSKNARKHALTVFSSDRFYNEFSTLLME